MKKLQFIILFFLITPICVTNAQVKVAHIEVPKLTDIIFTPEIYIPILAFFSLVLITIFLRRLFYQN